MAFLNPYTLKRMMATCVLPIVVCICWQAGMMYGGILWSIVGLFVGVFFNMVVAKRLLSNPFSSMLEGQGILAFDINSSGFIQIFNMVVMPPKVTGVLNGKEINDVFDRNSMFRIAPPSEMGTATPKKDGGWTLEVDEAQYNQNKFAVAHYPCFVYNSATRTCLTKEALSTLEMRQMAEHNVLALLEETRQLNTNTRNLARTSIDLFANMGGFMQGIKDNLIWIVVIIGLLVAVYLGWPYISQFMGNVGGAVGTAATTTSAAVSTVG